MTYKTIIELEQHPSGEMTLRMSVEEDGWDGPKRYSTQQEVDVDWLFTAGIAEQLLQHGVADLLRYIGEERARRAAESKEPDGA